MAVGTSVCGSVDAQFGQPIAPSPAEEKGGEVERLPRVVPKRALYEIVLTLAGVPRNRRQSTRAPGGGAHRAPAFGRPRRDLLDEPLGECLGQCRNGEVLLVTEDPSGQIAKPIGRVTRQRRMCSITSNASTMLNVGTRQSAT